jgi:hypothetical protein
MRNELDNARGNELTAQTVAGFEMQFQRRIETLRFQLREVAPGTAGEPVEGALALLSQMPRAAASEDAAYDDLKRKLESVLGPSMGGT